MGGSSFDDDSELAFPSNGGRNIVLVGRTGNGKSATGNSILGWEAFKSGASSAGVTGTCELRKSLLEDGQVLNVIDTPGLFDFSGETEFIGKEIVRCFEMAKEGIHAVILVFSVTNRFTKEEEAALQSLHTFFGSKINDYLIVVFTGGDILGKNQTLEDYFGVRCPKPLKEILLSCNNRRVLFDNKTKDEFKKAEQLKQLLLLVDMVVEHNGGLPYTDEVFAELKKGADELRRQKEEVSSLASRCSNQNPELSELTDKMYRSYEEKLKRITETVESKLKESIRTLEQQLAEERAARREAEENAQKEVEDLRNCSVLQVESKLKESTRMLEQQLIEEPAARRQSEENAQKEVEDLRNCSVLQVESKLKESTRMLEQQLAEERAARREAEGNAWKEVEDLRIRLESAQRETNDLRKLAERGNCSIL